MSKNSMPYTALDLQSLAQKKNKIVSSKEALKDVTPVRWDDDVLKGRKKVTVTKAER